MKHGLIHLVKWAHGLLAEVVQPGDLAVDLTTGNGHDILALSQLVGHAGQVIGFDIQSAALMITRERLIAAGAVVRFRQADHLPLQPEAGIDLLEMSHAELALVLPLAAKGIIANLGYLPGGNRELITHPESTLQALQQACSHLAAGGRLVVVVYPGHPGGVEEGAAVTTFFSELSEKAFQVLQLKVSNCPRAPFLFVAEKLG